MNSEVYCYVYVYVRIISNFPKSSLHIYRLPPSILTTSAALQKKLKIIFLLSLHNEKIFTSNSVPVVHDYRITRTHKRRIINVQIRACTNVQHWKSVAECTVVWTYRQSIRGALGRFIDSNSSIFWFWISEFTRRKNEKTGMVNYVVENTLSPGIKTKTIF